MATAPWDRRAWEGESEQLFSDSEPLCTGTQRDLAHTPPLAWHKLGNEILAGQENGGPKTTRYRKKSYDRNSPNQQMGKIHFYKVNSGELKP